MRPIRRFLNDVVLLTTPRHDDERGSLIVGYEREAAAAAGLPTEFVQDTHSISRQAGTIRGLHLQLRPHEQGKLVRVLRGRVADVVVDLRPGSATRGHHAVIELSAGEGHQLWVPRGFAHGFCTLEPGTEVLYKVDAPYAPAAERSLAWDDPELAIDWPASPGAVVLSAKDAAGRALHHILDEVDEAARAGSPPTEAVVAPSARTADPPPTGRVAAEGVAS